MNNRKNIGFKIWDILYPIGMYYVTMVIMMFLAQSFFGTGTENYMLCQILASVVTIPVIYSFYRHDRLLSQRAALRELAEKSMIKTVLWEMVIAALFGIALNNLISMSPLVEISGGYQEANAHFYGGALAAELIGSVLIVPLLEELLYRGVVYYRLKESLPFVPSVLISAALFGLIHFNVVQFLYAFLIGMILAIFVEKSGHMYGAVVGHMTANAIAVIRTETGWLAGTADGSAFAWIVSVMLLLFGLGFLYFGLWRTGTPLEKTEK